MKVKTMLLRICTNSIKNLNSTQLIITIFKLIIAYFEKNITNMEHTTVEDDFDSTGRLLKVSLFK